MPQSSRRPPAYPSPVPASRPAPAPARRPVSAPATPESATPDSATLKSATPATPAPAGVAPSRSPAPRKPPAPPVPQVASAARQNPAHRDVVVRTLGLKLLGVAGIVHASLVLMALVVLGVLAAGGDARVGFATSAIRATSAPLYTWTLCAAALSFVLTAVMLYNAIGTLSLTPWSQRATKIWAAAWLALAAVALVVNLGWIYPLLRAASAERFTTGRLMLVTALHVAAGLAWPVIVLGAMNTRHVKQIYARVASGAASM